MATTFSQALIYNDTSETWEDKRFFNNCGKVTVIVYKRQRFILTRNPYLRSHERVTLAQLAEAGFERIHVLNHGIGTAVKTEA